VIERFESNWLGLREPADADARDRALAERARSWLDARPRPLRVVDLGAGSGANPRYLAPRLPGPQHWRLIDHDAELLQRADVRLAAVHDAGGIPVGFDTCRMDLTALGTAIEDHTDLATASALFDLVSADWVEALATRCAAVGCAVLWTLSVDGEWHFTGPDGNRIHDERDATMLELLQAHQTGEKGLGRALGGAAPDALRSAFIRRGYDLAEASSPWRLLPGTRRALALALIDGWRSALHEQAPDEAAGINAWWRARRAGITAGELGMEVGHIDIYGEPPA